MSSAIPPESARVLLMQGAGLLEPPTRRVTMKSLAAAIRRMGYVQLDSINIVERAHHLTIAARFDGYRRDHLTRLSETERALFEHWTHDASLIPRDWLPQWKLRFRLAEESPRLRRWLHGRMGENPKALMKHVLARIRGEGPLMSRDFEKPARRHGTGWWDWKPQKAALEYLWMTGRLAVTARRDFHKVYDLAERVFPELPAARAPRREAYRDWACASALDRLGVATPAELAEFWGHLTAVHAKEWCRRALESGAAVPASATGNGASRLLVAVPDHAERIARAPEPPDVLRLLSPFDPLIRDRKRLARLFGFEYRFEAFVPAAKRRHGYYVLPILEGDRFTGRLDAKLQRDRGHIELRHLSAEPGIRLTRKRLAALDDALERLARLVGATSWDPPARTAR